MLCWRDTSVIREKPKHQNITELLERYIEENNTFYSGLTSWVNRVSEFRHGKFSFVAYGNDAQLDTVVREFADTLTAWYSLTDGSSLKKALLDILDDTPLGEQQDDRSNHNERKDTCNRLRTKY